MDDTDQDYKEISYEEFLDDENYFMSLPQYQDLIRERFLFNEDVLSPDTLRERLIGWNKDDVRFRMREGGGGWSSLSFSTEYHFLTWRKGEFSGRMGEDGVWWQLSDHPDHADDFTWPRSYEYTPRDMGFGRARSFKGKQYANYDRRHYVQRAGAFRQGLSSLS